MISIPLIMLLVVLPLIAMWAAYLIIELCTDIWVPEWLFLMGSGAFKLGIAVLVVCTFCMAIKPAKKFFKENVKIEDEIVVDKEE